MDELGTLFHHSEQTSDSTIVLLRKHSLLLWHETHDKGEGSIFNI